MSDTVYDDGYEETFRLLGKYDTTERDISQLLELVQLPVASHVLDIPCGFGRHAEVLCRYGMRVTGLDSSRFQLENARKRDGRIEVVLDDMTRPPSSGSFDLIVNLWTSFGYLQSEADDFSALEAWRRVLRPHGHLVMELSTLENARLDAAAGDEPISYRISMRNGVRERAAFNWVSGIADVEYSRPGWCRRFYTRMYSREELRIMLQEAGFGNIALYGGFDGTTPRDDRRTVIVARL